MTEWNGQCRRQYGNVSNQFNECIQNCQHIRQWCARRRHNSQQIELFVFSGVFSSTALPATSELVSARFSLFINCSVFLSVSTFAFSWTLMVSLSLKLHVHVFALITVCHLIKRAGYVLPPSTFSIFFGIMVLYCGWIFYHHKQCHRMRLQFTSPCFPSNSSCRRLSMLTLTYNAAAKRTFTVSIIRGN